MNAAGAELLERALTYALCSVKAVSRTDLAGPTPCRYWDLWTLLRHVNESLAALLEGVETGHVNLAPAGEGPHADPVRTFQERATWLLGVCARPSGRVDVVIADCPLGCDVLAATGALELTVHGWDVARSCGLPRPIPYTLARDLLAISPHLVTDRRALFAAPVAVPSAAEPGDRLVAFLGRNPFLSRRL